MGFQYDFVPRMIFGEGSSERTGEVLRGLGCKRVMVIHDRGVREAGLVDPVVQNIEDFGVEVVCFDGVLPDPPASLIERTAELAKKEKVDGLVGLGGGSAMDTAKCVNVLLGNPGPLAAYFDQRESVPRPGVPLVSIPTTAGTGSEVSSGAVVTDEETQRKRVMSQTS